MNKKKERSLSTHTQQYYVHTCKKCYKYVLNHRYYIHPQTMTAFLCYMSFHDGEFDTVILYYNVWAVSTCLQMRLAL